MSNRDLSFLLNNPRPVARGPPESWAHDGKVQPRNTQRDADMEIGTTDASQLQDKKGNQKRIRISTDRRMALTCFAICMGLMLAYTVMSRPEPRKARVRKLVDLVAPKVLTEDELAEAEDAAQDRARLRAEEEQKMKKDARDKRLRDQIQKVKDFRLLRGVAHGHTHTDPKLFSETPKASQSISQQKNPDEVTPPPGSVRPAFPTQEAVAARADPNADARIANAELAHHLKALQHEQNQAAASAFERKVVLLVAYDAMPMPLESPHGCPVDCRVSSDRAHAPHAHGVIFHAPDNSQMPSVKTEGQVWIGLCMEDMKSEWCSKMEAAFDGQIDWRATYTPDADVSVYAYVPLPEELRREVPLKLSKSAPAALLLSTCHHSELQQHIEIASYGKCLHNAELPIAPPHGPMASAASKEHAKYSPSLTWDVLNALSHHKFYLAFERHDSDFYHTEKFWTGFAAGALPVYWGSRTILTEKYGPGKDSFIYARDFPKPKDLAEHLKMLDQHPDLYEKHFQWKTSSLSEHYFRHKAHDVSNLACNICKKIADAASSS